MNNTNLQYYIIVEEYIIGGIILRDRRLFVILLIVLMFVVAGCGEGINEYSTLVIDDYNGIDLDKVNHYHIEVDFNPEDKSYSVTQKVTYTNNTGKELNELYFHLYPNAYRKLETAPILFDDEILSKGYNPGYIDIEELKVDNNVANFQIQGEGDTILKIELSRKLENKEEVVIGFKYKGKLPLNIDRFGYGENVFNFGNWYPIACVYDETGWNLDPYYNLGDPFYSNISNYDVTIIVPKDMIVAASGNILDEEVKNNEKVYKIEGKLIRDFAWVASNDFVIRESEVGDTVVRLYALEDNEYMADFALQAGTKSIQVFNKIFGKYPYGVYSVVMTEFPTGMEYPGIVFINKDYYNEISKQSLEQVIVHETAHQWWYGVVGNDQIDEAWLDESLATYSEVIYMHDIYGKGVGEDYYSYYCELPYEYMMETLTIDEVVDKSLDEFQGWDDYGVLVYTKGAMFLNSIKEDFGMEKLYEILSEYYNTYRFYNANTEDFLKICEQVTNTSFEERANQWLYDK